MSAFYVGPEHINAMLTYVESIKPYSIPMPNGTSHNVEQDRYLDNALTIIGQNLLNENVKSLKARYPGDNWAADQYRYEPDYGFMTRTSDPALATIKLVHCFEYQACEHDLWETSYAREFCRWLVELCIYRVKGYDDYPWGYSKPKDEPQVISLSRLARS